MDKKIGSFEVSWKIWLIFLHAQAKLWNDFIQPEISYLECRLLHELKNRSRASSNSSLVFSLSVYFTRLSSYKTLLTTIFILQEPQIIILRNWNNQSSVIDETLSLLVFPNWLKLIFTTKFEVSSILYCITFSTRAS